MEFVPLLMVGMKHYWFVLKRIVLRHTNSIALHSFLYWRRLPIVPPSIYCAKASYAQSHDIPLRSDTQALRLIARIPLIQRRKSAILVKTKAPSHSGFPLSMHVVLKTRHVNPNIHVRRYQIHVRSPNLSATRPQLLSLCGATTQYRSLHKAIQ